MRCLPTIYSICNDQALVPRSLVIPLPYDPRNLRRSSRRTDVWKCQCDGRMVVAKALRLSGKDDLRRIRGVGYQCCSRLYMFTADRVL